VSTDYDFSFGDVMDEARRKHGVEGWVGYQWAKADRDSIVTAEVPVGVYSKGKNKGRPKYGKANAHTRAQVVVTEAEMIQAAIRYEGETGKCWNRKGTGKEWAGWDHKEGTKYQPCRRCGGIGDAMTGGRP
jgi:hypothetical protein